jgi:hypothetical protein
MAPIFTFRTKKIVTPYTTQYAVEAAPEKPALKSAQDIKKKLPQSKVRVVSFDAVTVHTFDVEVGDNPSVSCGVPVALSSSRPTSAQTYSVNTFEMSRVGCRRRGEQGLALTPTQRWEVLQMNGHDHHDMIKSAHRASSIRQLRERALFFSGCDEEEEDKENTAPFARLFEAQVFQRSRPRRSKKLVPTLLDVEGTKSVVEI